MISFNAQDIFLITGASSGLGEACALLLNKLGATVIANGRDQSKLQDLAARCSTPQRCQLEALDLAAPDQDLCTWVKQLKNKYGKLRGFVHSAGICQVLPVRLQSSESMRQLFEINVMSAYQIARGFLDRRNNSGHNASIVFIASDAALYDNAGITSYSASKGAVISMMRSIACEFATQGIRANAISPSLIPTAMTKQVYPDILERASLHPLGAGKPDDIAHTAAFLLSDAARWITGQNIIVDGGTGLV